MIAYGTTVHGNSQPYGALRGRLDRARDVVEGPRPLLRNHELFRKLSLNDAIARRGSERPVTGEGESRVAVLSGCVDLLVGCRAVQQCLNSGALAQHWVAVVLLMREAEFPQFARRGRCNLFILSSAV